ncbi:MAG: hypothetical protein AAFN94_05970 [Pseudomonadota bacterium]
MWVYLPVPIATLNEILGTQCDSLAAFPFEDLSAGGDMGLMNINFMTYASDSGVNDPQSYADITKPITFHDPMPASMGIEPTHECEINIVSYSRAKEAQTPFGLSSSQFIEGRDHTKRIGNYRLWVPCDDRIAVYWGMHNFGENKLMTYPFVYNNPAPNNPGRDLWDFTIPATVDEPANETLFALKVQDIAEGPGVVASNQSEIIDFSLYPHAATNPPQQRLVASRRNVFGQFKCMTMDSAKAAGMAIPPCELTIGNAAHQAVSDLKTMLSTSNTLQPVGLMTYGSQPVIAESSLYFADI